MGLQGLTKEWPLKGKIIHRLLWSHQAYGTCPLPLLFPAIVSAPPICHFEHPAGHGALDKQQAESLCVRPDEKPDEKPAENLNLLDEKPDEKTDEKLNGVDEKLAEKRMKKLCFLYRK